MSAIRFEGVRVEYPRADGRRVVAVEGLDLVVEQGETLCLIGTSGCGKTTCLKVINRLVVPTSGRVLVRGEDLATVDPIRLRRGLGWVIQRGGLFPHLTVADNVGLLCQLEGWDRERIRERVDDLLTRVSLPPERFRDRYPRALSGGQRQRVGVARALALDPPIVLMDEPFGALDPITRRKVQRQFLELQAAVHKTTVVVTHDLQEAFLLGDRVALLDKGRLVQVGTPEALQQRPASEFVRRFVAEAG